MTLGRFFGSAIVWGLVLLIGGPVAGAAITVTTLNENYPANHTVFDGLLSSGDLIHGLIATERPGDTGWHEANPAAGDSMHPNGLPAFTDGNGALNSLTGLLNDFPGEGTPTKLLQYDLAAPSDISEINILAGNANDPDGRVFVTVVINYSTDGGLNFQPLGGYVPTIGPNSSGYYQSHPSGTVNQLFAPEGIMETHATFMQIHDDAGANIASGVTNLQFDFYSVDNTLGEMRDPFDGVNPFTGVDDGLTHAFVSPLIWEIDVIAGAPQSADFNGDGFVDGADMLIWQRGYGIDDGSAQPENGDATGDGNVNGADLAVWEAQFGTTPAPLTAAQSIPEPSSLGLLLIGMTSGLLLTRRNG